MKKLLCIVGAVLLSINLLHTQELPHTEKTQGISLGLISLEYNYETPLSRLTTVNLHGGLGADIGFKRWNNWNGQATSNWFYAIRGLAGADFRYYHNLDRRHRKGKNTSSNSGNFFSVDFLYASPPIHRHKTYDTQNSLLIYPSYGLRRAYKSGIYIEGRAGYAVGVDFGKYGTYWGNKVKLNFKIGYSF